MYQLKPYLMNYSKYQRSNQLNGDILNKEISVLSIENGIIVNKDGSIGCGFKLDASYSPSLSTQSLDTLFKTLNGFLNSLPEHYDIQTIWTQNSRTSDITKKLESIRFSEGITGEVQKEQQNNILYLLAEGELRWIDVYFLIIRKVVPSEVDKTSEEKYKFKKILAKIYNYFTDINSTFTYSKNYYVKATSELNIYSEQLNSLFNNLGFNPVKLNDHSITNLFFQRWNPRQFNAGSNPRLYKLQSSIPFTEYFTQSTFSWDPSGESIPSGIAELDGWYHAIMTMQEPPEEVSGFIFDDLLLLDGVQRCELIVNVERGNRADRIKRLKNILNQRLNHNETSDDPSQRTATREIEIELENMGTNSESTWRAAVYIHLWAPDTNQLIQDAAKLQSLARSKDIILIQEKRALWPYWRTIQPFWTQDKDRYRLLDYSTSQLTRILPLFGQPSNLQSDKKIGILYQTVSRSIFNWVVPDETLFNNPHYLIVGGTGSGKSALAVENLLSFRRRSSQVIIIDLGGSFVSFCNSCGGVYIDYNIQSRSNRINPLWLPQGTIPDSEILRSRTLWLESLLAERGKRLSAEDLVILEESLRKTYLKDLDIPIYLRNIRNTLLNDPKGEHLSRRLSPWCDEGALSNLFDGPTLIDLSAPVIVFDLKRVMHDQRDTDLARIIFSSIVNTVVSLSLTHTKEAKYLVFDEAGVLLKDEATAEFMEYCFRTLRKTGVSVSALSQGLEDFMGAHNTRNGLIGSADNLFVLRQDNADKAHIIAKEKNLSASELSLIESLTTVPGRHAEFALIQQTPFGQRTLHLLSASTPLKYAFTANSPEDRRKLFEYQKLGLSRQSALLKFSKEFPAGIISSNSNINHEV